MISDPDLPVCLSCTGYRGFFPLLYPSSRRRSPVEATLGSFPAFCFCPRFFLEAERKIQREGLIGLPVLTQAAELQS